jgi:hypothetical protein
MKKKGPETQQFCHYIPKKQIHKGTEFRSQTVSWHLFLCGNLCCYNCDQHYKTGRTGVLDEDNQTHSNSSQNNYTPSQLHRHPQVLPYLDVLLFPRAGRREESNQACLSLSGDKSEQLLGIRDSISLMFRFLLYLRKLYQLQLIGKRRLGNII